MIKRRFISAVAVFLAGFLAGGLLMLYTPLPGNIAHGYIWDGSDFQSASLLQDAQHILQLIEKRNFETLSSWTHPDKGLTFVPYSTISNGENQILSASEVGNLKTDSKLYVWGTNYADGSPINLTTAEYFSRYIADYDYANAPVIAFNTIIKSGNSLENVRDYFPDAEFCEFHYPGTADRSYTDWKSLKLVFEDYEGARALVAIIHSEWTS